MEQSNSEVKTPKEIIEQHKKALAEKKNSSSRYIALLQSQLDALEETTYSSWQMVEDNKSMLKTASRMADGIDLLNDNVHAFNNSVTSFLQNQNSMSAYVENMVDNFEELNDSDNSLFDEDLMSEKIGDIISDQLAPIAQLPETISQAVTPMIDGDFEDSVSDTANYLGDPNEEKKNVSKKGSLMHFLSSINDNTAEVANYYKDLRIKKKGKTGDPTEDKPKDDDKFSLSDMLFGWLGLKKLKNFITKTVGKFFSKIAGWFTYLSRWIATNAKIMWRALKKSSIGKLVSKVWEKFSSSVVSYFGGALNTVKAVISKVWEKIMASGPVKFIKMIGGKIGGMVTKVLEFLSPVIKFLEPFIGKASFLGKALSKFTGFFTKMFGKVAGMGLKAIPFIGEIWIAVDFLWDFFKGFGDDTASEITGKSKDVLTFWDKLKSGISNALSGLLFGLIDSKKIYGVIESVSKSVVKVVNDFLSLIPQSWKQAGKSLYEFLDFKNPNGLAGRFKTAVVDIWKKSVSWISDTASSIWDSIKSVMGDLWTLIPKGIKGIIDLAIKWFTAGAMDSNGLTDVGNIYKDFVVMVVDKIKSFMASIANLVPSSVKDFISSTVSSATSKLEEGWGAVKGMFGGEPTSASASASATKATIATAPVASTPQPLNTKTADITDTLASKPQVQQEKPQAPVVVNNTTQGSKTGISRHINSGQSDLKRIVTGPQFGFGN